MRHTHTGKHIWIYICLYIYTERERQKHVCIFVYAHTYTVSVKPHNFCFCKCYMYVYIDTRDTLCMHIQGLYVEKAGISLHFLYSSIFSLHTMAFHIASYRLIPYHTIPHSFHFDLSETWANRISCHTYIYMYRCIYVHACRTYLCRTSLKWVYSLYIYTWMKINRWIWINA